MSQKDIKAFQKWSKSECTDGRFTHTLEDAYRAGWNEHQARVEKLEGFARAILAASSEGCDIDGGDAQEIMVKHGILKPVPVTEPCTEGYCQCADFDNIPGDCLRSTLPDPP